MGSDSVRGIDRRRVIKWGGAAAAGAPLVNAGIGHAGPSGRYEIPPDTRPGGAYDRYVARLAADGRFSGVVLLSHRGRTVLSRGYGLADRERGIRNHEGTAFTLSSAGKPFHSVAILQLAQQGRLELTDPIGRHLTGFANDIAEQVTIHYVMAGRSGTVAPAEDVRRVFHSRTEVREYYERLARQSKLVAPVGLPVDHSLGGAGVALIAMVIEAVTGQTYWDYIEEHIFRRCGMTGSAFYTRPRWLTDERLAHPYMTLADGSAVDAIRHLDRGSPFPYMPDKNPGRAFIDAPGDGGFATAPDLVRFAHALGDGTLLDRPWADVFTAAKDPVGPGGFTSYGPPLSIVGGQWQLERSGANPGVGAHWSIFPDTGWVGVILSNSDDAPLLDMIDQETRAITGVSSGG